MKNRGFRICLAVIASVTAAARAERGSSATARVIVEVRPKIAVSAVASPVVRSGSGGKLEAVIAFVVEANLHEASVYVEASDLQLTGNNAGRDVPRIPLDTATPAVIDPASATPHSGDNTARWIGPGKPIGDYDTHLSESIRFESEQACTFAQQIDVTVTWNPPRPDMPTGRYGGMVRLTALVTPQ